MPKASPPSRCVPGEIPAKAIASAAEFLLQTYGIPLKVGIDRLRFAASEIEKTESYNLRYKGAWHEEAGQWDQAIDYYNQAIG